MRPAGRVAGPALAALFLLGVACGPIVGHGSSSSPVQVAPSPLIGQRVITQVTTNQGNTLCPSATTAIGTVTSKSITARTAPTSSAPVVAAFKKVNDQGAPQVFDLLEGLQASDGTYWAKALLPMRPNGTVGYLPQRDLNVAWTSYALSVSKEHRTLTLWKDCRRVGTYPVGIGTGDTPTPRGVFYLGSLLKPPSANSVYGTYAYGLSAYSDVIRTWRWGGLIGLHGTNDPGSIGHYVSHGCIRMRNEDIEKLVKVLPLGTPIAIG